MIEKFAHKSPALVNLLLQGWYNGNQPISKQHCRVMKLAAMPSCLGGGEAGINYQVAPRVVHPTAQWKVVS